MKNTEIQRLFKKKRELEKEILSIQHEIEGMRDNCNHKFLEHEAGRALPACPVCGEHYMELN